jgi:hypothetical protein
MNRSLPSPAPITRTSTSMFTVANQPIGPSQHPYGEREFGVGYGRSSGYASQRQYVSGWSGQPRFRCV